MTVHQRRSFNAKALLASILFAGLIWLCAAPTANAVTQFWDVNGALAGLGGSGTWDVGVTPNWNVSTGTGTATVWTNGNDANFQGTGTNTVTLSGAITAGAMSVSNTNIFNGGGTNTLAFSSLTTAANGLTTTFNGGVAGTDVTLVSNLGAGNNFIVAFTGTNTFTGNVNMNGTGAGTTSASRLAVLINSIGAIPTTAAFNYSRNLAQVDFNITGNHGNVPNNFNLNTGSISNYEGWIGAINGATVNLTGLISGAGTLTFGLGVSGGAGVITLTPAAGAETYTGGTKFLNAATGVIKLGADNVLPTITGLSFGSGATSSGSLDLNGKNQTIASLASAVTTGTVNGVTNTQATTSTLTIKGSATTTYAGPLGVATNVTNLTGSNDHIALVLDAANSGVLTLSGASAAGVTYDGGTTINGGILVVNNTSGSGTGSGNITIGVSGTLKIGDGGNNGSVSGNITDNGSLVFNRGNALSYLGQIDGIGTLTKSGVGQLTLNNTSSSYSGGTTLSQGTIVWNQTNALGQGGIVTINDANTGTNTTALYKNSQGTLSHDIVVATGGTGTTIGSDTGTNTLATTYSGSVTLNQTTNFKSGTSALITFTGAVGGSGGVNVIGGGTVELDNSNGYGGGTTLTSGTLLANNTSGSATGSGAVSVTAGTLGGNGSISGAVTMNGGTLNAGSSATPIATLNTGALTFKPTSTFVFDMNTSGTPAADLLNANGALQILGPGVSLVINDPNSAALTQNTKFTLISYTGANPGAFDTYPDASSITVGANTFVLNYHDTPAGSVNGGSGANAVTLTFTAVPEAGPILLGGVLCLAIGSVVGTRKMLGKRAAA